MKTKVKKVSSCKSLVAYYKQKGWAKQDQSQDVIFHFSENYIEFIFRESTNENV